jgi:hypothetical protein
MHFNRGRKPAYIFFSSSSNLRFSSSSRSACFCSTGVITPAGNEELPLSSAMSSSISCSGSISTSPLTTPLAFASDCLDLSKLSILSLSLSRSRSSSRLVTSFSTALLILSSISSSVRPRAAPLVPSNGTSGTLPSPSANGWNRKSLEPATIEVRRGTLDEPASTGRGARDGRGRLGPADGAGRTTVVVTDAEVDEVSRVGGNVAATSLSALG